MPLSFSIGKIVPFIATLFRIGKLQFCKAIIGTRDFIFPTKNQLKAWGKIKYEIIDEAHFLDFNKYVD
mgnify:CR=1 FL=1